MDITVSWWAVAVVLGLAACGFLAVCWIVSGWAEQAADWWRRDRVTPLLEDEVPCRVCGSIELCEHDDPLLNLPPERTWEQMTSHQLPLGGPEEDLSSTTPTRRNQPIWPTHVLQVVSSGNLGPQRERRMPGWEAESRQAYAALDLEYPSGLMARVRELAP